MKYNLTKTVCSHIRVGPEKIIKNPNKQAVADLESVLVAATFSEQLASLKEGHPEQYLEHDLVVTFVSPGDAETRLANAKRWGLDYKNHIKSLRMLSELRKITKACLIKDQRSDLRKAAKKMK